MGISAALGSSALLPAGLGFRNVIINGDMRVAQRGLSFFFGSGGGNQYFGADRWSTVDYTWSAGTNITVANETTVVPSGFTNSYKWANGATPLTFNSGGYQAIRQKIEGYSASSLYGKQCVLSFWVRSSTAGKYSIWFFNNANTRSLLKTYVINSADTWEYKTVYIDMASAVTSGVWEKTSSTGLGLMFTLGTSSNRTGSTNLDSWGNITAYEYATSDSVNLATIANSTFYLTGVQLEANYQPTPFEQRPYGVELALCQRYYTKISSSRAASYAGQGQARGGTAYVLFGAVPLPTTMRIPPALSTNSISAEPNPGSTYALSNSIAAYSTTTNATFYTTRSSGTWASDLSVLLIFDSTSYVAADAEL